MTEEYLTFNALQLTLIDVTPLIFIASLSWITNVINVGKILFENSKTHKICTVFNCKEGWSPWIISSDSCISLMMNLECERMCWFCMRRISVAVGGYLHYDTWKWATTSNKAAKIHTAELSKLLPAGICQEHLRVLAFVLHRELCMGALYSAGSTSYRPNTSMLNSCQD